MLRHWVHVVALLSLVTGCTPGGQDGPVTTVRIATNDPGGVFYPLGQALASLYGVAIPDIRPIVDPRGVSSATILQALEEGSADLAFARADAVYYAYTYGRPGDPTPATRLRGIGVLYPNVLHVIVRSESPVRNLADLRGTKVAYGSPRELLPSPLTLGFLVAGGVLGAGDVTGVGMSFDDVVRAVAAGNVEGGLLMSGYPFAIMNQIGAEAVLRFIEVAPDVATRIRGKYPFFKPMEIPAGTYSGQDKAVMTIGVDSVLVCREDLEEDLVYLFTRAIFEELPLTHVSPILTHVDPDAAPATPIPLHPGAARYYRERELVH